MPLKQPGFLREKTLLIGGAGTGKTTAWLSIAWWAFLSKDTRTFYVLDTDDEAVLQVMNEPRYDGMLRSFNGETYNEGGNVVIYSAYNWDDYMRFSDKMTWEKSIASQAQPGDFIVIDFVSHLWVAAQDGYVHDAANKTRGSALREAGVAGLSGWDMYKQDFNWNAINGSYFDVLLPILLQSRAHVFMTAEEDQINVNNPKLSDADKAHLQFSTWKAVGQKKLPYQCRSYLRMQRLARGRVLTTNGKDRARKEFDGDTCEDFFQMYMVGAAGWEVVDPE